VIGWWLRVTILLLLMRRLSACVDAEGGHFEHYLYDRYSQHNNVKMATL